MQQNDSLAGGYHRPASAMAEGPSLLTSNLRYNDALSHLLPLLAELLSRRRTVGRRGRNKREAALERAGSRA